MRIWAARVFIKSENFKLFEGVCFDGVFRLSIFTSVCLRFGFLEQLYEFCCCMKVFPLHLNGFDICECGHVLVACQVFGKLRI